MNQSAVRRVHLDYPLLIVTILLVGLGLTMVYSATAVIGMEKYNDSYYFIRRSLIFTVMGIGALSFSLHFSYYHWRKLVYPILGVTCLMMLLVIFSPMGVTVGGARRWLDLGVLRVQPSELCKFALVLFMAYSLHKKSFDRLQRFSVGIVPHLIITFLITGLILAQKDLGTSMVCALLVGSLLFLSGVRISHLLSVTIAALPLLVWMIIQEGYRLQRILSFLNPWEDRYGSGFQMIQSYLAFNEGGFLGKGLGAGQQKLFYLPEAHTDFIFSVLGEELGLVGVVATILLFAFFCYRGFRIAVRTNTLFGRHLAMGLTLMVGLQAMLNMGIVMGLLPTKGLVLPFVSYGGSSLLVTLFAVGVLLNISTYQGVAERKVFSVDRNEKNKTKNKKDKKDEINLSLWGDRWSPLSRDGVG